MNNIGKFVIDRAIFDNPLWQDKPFTKGQAWVDLVGHAEYEDTTVLKGYELFDVKRGEVLTTLNELATRWGWNTSKVNKFLSFLESENQIERKTKNKGTLISIEKYSIYQFENSKMKNERKTKEKPIKNKEKTDEKPTSYKKRNNSNKSNKNARARVELDEVLSEAPEELLDSLYAFIEMRNKIKAPLTGEALKRIISKVNTLSNGDIEIAKEIILQSVERSWRGVFELKDRTTTRRKSDEVVDIMDIDMSDYGEEI